MRDINAMNSPDFYSITEFISVVWHLGWSALGFNPAAYQFALKAPMGLELALSVLLVGGISIAIGQSGVLFANRIKPRRFILALLVQAGILVVSVVFWAISIWFVAGFWGETSPSMRDMLIVVCLSYAPFWFGFLVILPYLGNIIYTLLRLWTFLALLLGVTSVTSLDIWQALLSGILGWILLEIITHLPLLHIKTIDNWLWRTATGTPVRLNPEQAAEQLAQEAASYWSEPATGDDYGDSP